MMVYWQLFYTFFKIGLFGFGGGNAMIPMIQFELVERFGWITSAQFTDMVAVSQMTPGPIGINCATYAGYLASGGVLGAAVATFALILPSFLIMLAVAHVLGRFRNNFYVDGALAGLRPAVIGLLLATVLLLINEENFGAGYSDWIGWAIFVASFVLSKWLKMNPILVIVVAAAVGLVVY